jgi:hypothetical protein
MGQGLPVCIQPCGNIVRATHELITAGQMATSSAATSMAIQTELLVNSIATHLLDC